MDDYCGLKMNEEWKLLFFFLFLCSSVRVFLSERFWALYRIYQSPLIIIIIQLFYSCSHAVALFLNEDFFSPNSKFSEQLFCVHNRFKQIARVLANVCEKVSTLADNLHNNRKWSKLMSHTHHNLWTFCHRFSPSHSEWSIQLSNLSDIHVYSINTYEFLWCLLNRQITCQVAGIDSVKL